MRDHLRAGIAVYNAGGYHAAHDAWEDRWLDLERGTDDERFLHGLIQFTAAVHHARERNWDGVAGLVESADEYLAGLPDEYRGVDVAAVRRHLAALGADPERVERERPPRLAHEGTAVTLGDLEFDAGAVAAAVLAAESERFDESVIDRAARYGREDIEAGRSTSEFVTFVLDFARDAEHRDIVYQRLADHVERRRHRESDVAGLFD
ncbi:DUF309 domain-containing protein [Halostella litorea]|uniref:DUF309 domain-containing protein n=1 Tax=Halostella litorea TaxID=2528831 RepID=UPI0010926A99|nr:DUF309 domain-containing protein [Halostella litorea]